MTDTGGATASAADVDWGPMDQQLHKELMEKKESSVKYKQMLVSCCVWQHIHTYSHAHILSCTHTLMHTYSHAHTHT